MRTGILDRWRGRSALLLAVLGVAVSLTGCGGGGGGGSSAAPATVKGQILFVDTNKQPTTPATVAVGNAQTTTNQNDGTFTLANAPSNATTLGVTAKDASNATVTLSLPIKLTANATNDLGVIYLSSSGYTATAKGRVVTQVNGQTQPVANATVTLSGQTAQTNTQGQFTITNLPVGLGSLSGALLGEATATDLGTTQITSDSLGPPLIAGNNTVNDVLLLPASGSQPLPPHTIAGKVTVQGNAPSATQLIQVQLISGGNNLGTVTADASGNYTFWVVPGTYTVKAVLAGFKDGQVNVTLQKLDTPVTATTINLLP